MWLFIAKHLRDASKYFQGMTNFLKEKKLPLAYIVG
jgi:hypothetical protein